MSNTRGTSWNFEIQIPSGNNSNGGIVYPIEIGEWGEGEEGRIEVSDGDRKYKIRDQIFNIDEIPVTILLRNNYAESGSEYDIMQQWCKSGDAKDVYLVARGSGKDPNREQALTAVLYQTELAMGKHSGFNRDSKTKDTKTYHMIPYDVEEIK